jgi:sulfatase maturation enzyme AslB (radical SAM superfamily)
MPTIRAKLIASLNVGHELSGSPDLLITLYMRSLYSICDLLSSGLEPAVFFYLAVGCSKYHMSIKTLCYVPYRQAFNTATGGYRPCCQTLPATNEYHHYTTFADWWQGPEMEELRNDLSGDTLPPSCMPCRTNELQGGQSFRQSVTPGDKSTTFYKNNLPDRYQVNFSSLCNLSCWTCTPRRSSMIEKDYRTIDILPVSFKQDTFVHSWPSLRAAILESYKHHDHVLLSLLGGEPTINNLLIEFMQMLVDLGYSERTTFELTTNCHTLRDDFKKLLVKNKWGYLTVFASVDLVDEKISWTRYGSKWSNIEKNLHFYKSIANYFEVHSTVSVFNAMYVPDIYDYFKNNNTKVSFYTVHEPVIMSPIHWSGSSEIFGDRDEFARRGLEKIYDTFGSDILANTKQQLIDHIVPLQEIRSVKLKDVDPVLYKLIFD